MMFGGLLSGNDGSSRERSKPASSREIAAVEDLERRSGQRVRDGERLHWEGVWPFDRLERG